MSNNKKIINKLFLIVKKNTTLRFIDIVISVSLTSALELGRVFCQNIINKLVVLGNNNGTNSEGINALKLDSSTTVDILTLNTLNNVAYIVLLSLIIWGITSISEMFAQTNRGKRKKIRTYFMLCVFIASTFWYMVGVFFLSDKTTLITTSVISIVLFLTNVIYIIKEEKDDVYNTDNRIA